MEALIAAFLESMLPQTVEAGVSEAVASGGGAPASMGADIGSYMGNMVNEQIAPTMEAFKGVTNPNATMGDMANSAFKYSFNPKEDEKSLMMPQMGGGYRGMANNYVGGIPSLLQNTNSGILPYIGSR
jgi:hypothetical protein